VLISDDEEGIARGLIRHLRRHGIGVFHDGDSDVVAMAASLKPHLILLDYMQRVNGGELLEALKANGTTASVPVLVMSAVDEDARREQCLGLGAIGFVAKPFPDDFVAEIVRWLGESAATPGAPWPLKGPRAGR
jgi:DNA-binding response OmpR family regulator